MRQRLSVLLILALVSGALGISASTATISSESMASQMSLDGSASDGHADCGDCPMSDCDDDPMSCAAACGACTLAVGEPDRATSSIHFSWLSPSSQAQLADNTGPPDTRPPIS